MHENVTYEQDYILWTIDTAKLLTERQFDKIDWKNLIEEIKDLSRREKQKLASLLTRLLEHLLKLMLWETQIPYNQNHWRSEIVNFRNQIRRILRDSPSLKPYLLEIYDECLDDAKKVVIQLIEAEISDEITIAIAQALDENWFLDRDLPLK